jgi:outer membrane protein OmpA-like peptidoglycan-associated protein
MPPSLQDTMNKKRLATSLTLLACAAVASAQTPAAPPAPTPEAEPGPQAYVGAATRMGLGYGKQERLRGELLQVLTESDTTAWLGEAWLADGAGGLKLSHHWLPAPASAASDARVRKLFVAADRNSSGDAKLTLGAGLEGEAFFAGLYTSASATGWRALGGSTTVSTQTVSGSDGDRAFQQDIVTSVRTAVYERAYGHGVGVRVGHFYTPGLVRTTLGADTEWGRGANRQTTLSLGVEKYFQASPFSLSLHLDHYRKTSGFEPDVAGNRVTAVLRYDFGGPAFRPVQQFRMVQVPAAARPEVLSSAVTMTPAAAPALARPAATDAAPAPPTRTAQLVKTTVSMSADAFFEFDKSVLTPAALVALADVASQIKASGLVDKLRITGHTCNMGSAAYNQALSQRRAQAVKAYFVGNAGMTADALIAEGLGLTEPRFPNTRQERYKNRRVDLEFMTTQTRVDEVVVPAVAAAPPAPANAPVLPAPALVAAEPQPAPVQWRREMVEQEPVWARRALRQSLPHKQVVDVYRQQTQATTVVQGERRYVNRLPRAVDDSFSVRLGSSARAFDVLANDSDPDGDPLTIVNVTVPGRGSAVIAAGQVSYTPAPGFVGTDTFRYTVSDGRGGSASATITVSVLEVPQ